MDRAAQIRLSIGFDVAAGGYVVRLSSPTACCWLLLDDDPSGRTQSEELCTETLIPLEAFEGDRAGDYLDRLFATHLRCLGHG
jgi:hypothetical protein